MNKGFYFIIRGILWVIFNIIYRIEVIGDNSKKEDRVMICSNHTSDLDPIILAITYKPPIHFMAKKELFKNFVFGYLLGKAGAFPVDRENTDIKSIRHGMGLLRDSEVLGVFPEGTRVSNIDYNNMKEGVSLIASKSKASIQPVYISTNYKPFSKIRVYYREPIHIEQFSGLPKKLQVSEITRELFNSIYDLESGNDNQNC